MPDLKTQLQEVKHKLENLSFDDEGEANTTARGVGSGSTRKVFDLISRNPGITRKRLLEAASAEGVMSSSATSLLTQFVRRGLVRVDETSAGKTFTAVVPEYISSYGKPARQAANPQLVARRLAPTPTTTVQDMLDTMSVSKARALYDELKKIFGSAA
jgi:hypothetical protein